MVDTMVAAVEKRLKDRDMGIELTQAAKNLLAERGFDPVLGARPLRRTIQREIEDNLAEKMLFGEVGPGQIVLVDVEGEGPTATFTFVGQKVGTIDDLPPFETADVQLGEALDGGPSEDDAGPADVPRSELRRLSDLLHPETPTAPGRSGVSASGPGFPRLRRMLLTASTVKDTLPNVERFVAGNLAGGADHLVVLPRRRAARGARRSSRPTRT